MSLLSLPSFSKEEKIFGKPFAHWIELFWNRFYYPDKARAWGKVFCLPGYISEVQENQRKTDYEIKQDKAILVAPMVFIGPTQLYVIQRMDEIELPIVFHLDGEDIGRYAQRVKTDAFLLEGKKEMYSDGYWIFLKPNSLRKDEHELDSLNTCSSGRNRQNLFYRLNII
jgi:hypothetical protein